MLHLHPAHNLRLQVWNNESRPATQPRGHLNAEGLIFEIGPRAVVVEGALGSHVLWIECIILNERQLAGSE